MNDGAEWQRVKLLFEAAMEQREMTPEAFAAARGTDPEVLRETLRLLAEESRLNTNFLKPPGKETLLHRAARAMARLGAPEYEGQLLAGRGIGCLCVERGLL